MKARARPKTWRHQSAHRLKRFGAELWFVVLFIVMVPTPGRAGNVPADLELLRFPDELTTFEQPVAIRAPKDGSGRIFVVEKCSGIRIVKGGRVLPDPFLSIDAACRTEQGVLGLAFDPAFAVNGLFYCLTRPVGYPRFGSNEDRFCALLVSRGWRCCEPLVTVSAIAGIGYGHNGVIAFRRGRLPQLVDGRWRCAG